MRKGIILDFKKIKFLNFLKFNKIFILLCIIFIVGIFIGAFIFEKNDALVEISKNVFENSIKLHKTNSWFSVLTSSFFKYLIILILYFLTGTSMFGVAIIPFVTAWQGIAFGNLSSYLYSTYTLKGIAFNAIILVPPAIIFTVCSFFAARESVNFSIVLAKLSFPKSRPANIYTDFKKFCGKFLIFISISLLSSITDLILNSFFLKFFDF